MARDNQEREALLRSGLAHARAAENYGNRTRDHDGYAIELALRLRELTGEDGRCLRWLAREITRSRLSYASGLGW